VQSVQADSGAVIAQQRTRARVANLLLERGPQTATCLADALGVSPAGVRRHLDAMLAEGSITTREQRHAVPRGRGRPARLYAVTDSGRDHTGPQAYDELARGALRFLAEHGGPDAVAAFAQDRAGRLEARWAEVRDVASLATALSADGYAASVETVPTGTTLCQHHCPVQHVAAAFPALCEAETAALSRVLGTHVQRLATIANGDGVCTTHIPTRVPPRVPARVPAAVPRTARPPEGRHP